MCSRVLSTWQMFSGYMSNEWDENLESSVGMLIIGAYAVPKLEKWAHLDILVSLPLFVPWIVGTTEFQ